MTDIADTVSRSWEWVGSMFLEVGSCQAGCGLSSDIYPLEEVAQLREKKEKKKMNFKNSNTIVMSSGLVVLVTHFHQVCDLKASKNILDLKQFICSFVNMY